MDEKDKRIAALEEENRRLRERLDELERRLGLNSKTSSKPPSSDGLRKKPAPKSLREKGSKPSGGQAGHPGNTLSQVEKPDSIVTHKLEVCPHCETDLAEVASPTSRKRQVFDMPPIHVVVTEHQAEVKVCPCCHQQVTAPFPSGIHAPVQYGDRLKSFAIYLNARQFIPEDRLQELFRDLFAIPISTATLAKICHTFGDKSLQDFDDTCFEQIKEAHAKHSDETSLRIGGKTCWLHLLSTPSATHYWVSPKRGDVVKALTNGVLIHDHFKSYYTHNPKVSHALCHAHHIRELNALIDIEKESWAKAMKRLLMAASQYQGKGAPPDRLRRLDGIYDTIIERGLAYHESLPPLTKKQRGRRKKRTGHNLLCRLRAFKEDVLRFLSDPHVPFTNNLAERDVRMMKIKQKISGGFRTLEGAQTFCRIRGFISTMSKQGKNILDVIKIALEGNAHTLLADPL